MSYLNFFYFKQIVITHFLCEIIFIFLLNSFVTCNHGSDIKSFSIISTHFYQQSTTPIPKVPCNNQTKLCPNFSYCDLSTGNCKCGWYNNDVELNENCRCTKNEHCNYIANSKCSWAFMADLGTCSCRFGYLLNEQKHACVPGHTFICFASEKCLHFLPFLSIVAFTMTLLFVIGVVVTRKRKQLPL